ncbi:MAG TPA: DUF3467 domain-containing protein [Planctomycetaceae bacterium]|nr:DUF3467 domain-containing protein [Planctomycetaceae bacterium]
MSDEHDAPQEGSPPQDEPSAAGGPTSQEIRHTQISARVPERVARGVFSTGAVVLQGAHEFIVDFLLRMTQPQQVAARVVLPPAVMARFIAALRENLAAHDRNFGPPPPPPAQPRPPAGQSQTSVQDLYDALKISDDVVSGTYANAVMIGHTASEFSFDFITTFFPRSAVSARVYLSAPNVPRFLESLIHSFDQYQRKLAEQQRRPPDRLRPPESL